jgi:CBS domain containing-hemolysin-like protein
MPRHGVMVRIKIKTEGLGPAQIILHLCINNLTPKNFAFCHKGHFCARFVFPLRNLAQNLAPKSYLLICDRTGLSL